MTEDLDYVREHIPDYRAYADEASRHDSDLRVRAYVGERLSQAQTQLSGTLDEATQKMLDEVLMRCMFTDQVFIRKYEHARLEAPMIAAFVRSDRKLLELSDTFGRLTAQTLQATLVELDKMFEYRRSPDPVPQTAS
jgi:hypothetical protein